MIKTINITKKPSREINDNGLILLIKLKTKLKINNSKLENKKEENPKSKKQ